MRFCRPQRDLIHGLLRLRGVAYHRAVVFEDTALFPGNGRISVAQQFGVVPSDAHDTGHQRVFHRIGGIQPPAKAHFQTDDVTALPRKPQQRGRRHRVELHQAVPALRAQPFSSRAHLCQDLRQRFPGNHFSVQQKTFAKFQHIGADAGAHAVSRPVQHRSQHYRCAALAVGSRNMHEPEAFFRIPQLFQQPPRIFHARMRGQPRQAVYPFQRLFIIHSIHPPSKPTAEGGQRQPPPPALYLYIIPGPMRPAPSTRRRGIGR